MTLKVRLERADPLPPARSDWVRIAAKGEERPVVRFVVGDQTVSFPTHVFRRWELTSGETDTLRILADREVITVKGRSLDRIRDALDSGLLLEVRARSARIDAGAETVVTIISFTVEKP